MQEFAGYFRKYGQLILRRQISLIMGLFFGVHKSSTNSDI